VRLNARLGQLREVAAIYSPWPRDLNVLYRALAGFTATYLDHVALEEGEALPALWESGLPPGSRTVVMRLEVDGVRSVTPSRLA